MVNMGKAVYCDICTFDSLRGNGKKVISIIENVLNHFVLPYKFPLGILFEKFNGKIQLLKYTTRTWDKIVHMILNDEIRHFFINYMLYEELYQPEFALSCTFDYAYKDPLYENRRIANNMAFSLNQRLFNDHIPLETQGKLGGIYTESFKELNGIIGYISMGNPHAAFGPIETHFEGIQGMLFTRESKNFDRYARGYFWGNVLTEKHIEKLGGIQLIKEKAPCYQVKEIKFGNRTAIYLQLSPDINDCSDEQLIQLRDYFKLILPPIDYEEINRVDPTGEERKEARLFFD